MVNGGPKNSRNCNPKEAAYCREFIVDFNKTKAAERAGYKKEYAKEQGYQLSTKLHIQEEIGRLLEKRAEKATVSVEYVLSKLVEVVEKSSQSSPVMRGGELVMVADENGDMRPQYTYDSSGVNKALDSIGKHLGMFIEKKELDIKTNGKPINEFVILPVTTKKDGDTTSDS